MKTKIKLTQSSLHVALALLAFSASNSQFSTAHAQATAFTFQGQLASGTGNANGSYDLKFAVYDANVAGNFIAGPVTNSAVAVSNGLFTVALNFGAGVFTGTNYWVEMGVRTNGGAGFATLVPRQQLTPTPYALYAPQSSNALYAMQAGTAVVATNALSLSASAPQFNSLCPVGSIMAYAGTTPPPGWLMCNTATPVSRINYAALFAAIGTNYGAGDFSTTFNLPDLRGVFLRGVDYGAGRDPDAGSRVPENPGGNAGNNVGSYQADMLASHTHSMGPVRQYHGPGGTSPWVVDGIAGYAAEQQNVSYSPVGGAETRPKNVSVNYIIKY